MTSNFHLSEFTRSDVAVRWGIDNSLPAHLLDDAELTLGMAERIRRLLGGLPVIITSGYRCLELNRRIGSKDTSDHTRALAIDFICPAFGSPFRLAKRLEAGMSVGDLGIGQLIHEFGSWVHVSRALPEKPINRVITIDHLGVRPGIVEAR